jgi:Ca-activated chloride channel homolog
MKKRALPLLLSLATTLMLAPLAKAAGMIVIDPILSGAPIMRVMPVRPGVRPGVVEPRPVPLLRGQVSFGLRLQAAEVRVDINDQVSRTYITQTFFNDTDQNLAGTYLFPLPDDTTFSSFSLHIDGKPVEGKILEAAEARQQYETIVRQMIDPGLLEYADYKTVRARIFPIPAHGSKKVELEYTQILKAENGMIKYGFPLKSEGETEAADEIKIDVKLASSKGLRTIWSPSHIISSKRDGDQKATASYLGKDVVPDKDFLLYYSISDKDMSANLLTHKDAGEDGYFLMTLSPPVQSKEVISKDIVFVADISGSMKGERMEQNKKALKYLVNALAASDRFSIVQFNTDVDAFKPNLQPATEENKKAALQFVDDMQAAGGTNMGDALKTAGGMLGSDKDRPSYLVLMTDGEPTVGETSTDGLLKVVDPKKDIRLFDVGIGYEVNTKLLNKLADDNHGTSQYVDPEESLEISMSGFYDKIKSPVLSNVKLSFEGVQTKDMYPRNVKDIFAGSQVLLLGKYKGGGVGTCKMTGTVNGVEKAYSFPLKFEEQALTHSYLPRLWAMRRIAHLSEVAESNQENREIIDEIVALSKKYGIITSYTSFLVTDPAENARIAAMRGGGGMLPTVSRPMEDAASPPPPPPVRRKGLAGTTAGYNHFAPGAFVAHGRLAAPSMPPPPLPATSFSSVATSVGGEVGSAGGAGSGEASFGDEGSDSPGIIAGSVFAHPASGKEAVMKARELNELKDSLAFENKKSDTGGLKTAGDKTFYLRDGYWTDSAYEKTKFPAPQEITFGSKEYFDLLKAEPGLSKYLAVGRQVIVVYKDRCYKISFKQDA